MGGPQWKQRASGTTVEVQVAGDVLDEVAEALS